MLAKGIIPYRKIFGTSGMTVLRLQHKTDKTNDKVVTPFALNLWIKLLKLTYKLLDKMQHFELNIFLLIY